MSSTFTVPGLDVTPTSATFAGSVAATGTITGPASVDAAAIADPGNAGAIPVTGSGQVALVSTGAQTRTLAAPARAGLDLILACDAHAGNIVVTCATTFNAAANNTLTFSAAGQMAAFKSIKVGANFRWRPYALDGAALSTV
jgi:hypothetical protein